MKAKISIESVNYQIDFNKPIDISIPLRSGVNNPIAWYTTPPKIEAEYDDDWIGSVAEGGSINFNKITFNPHAHGTHTECLGHITRKKISIQDCLKTFMFPAELISIAPKKINGDLQITKDQFEEYDEELDNVSAIVIRTVPNKDSKLTQQYQNTNWPYLTGEAAEYLVSKGIDHILIDLPSIDKEKDQGKLTAHQAFWQLKGEQRNHATITELIYVPDQIVDGTYLLNLQIVSFVNDASPSKPVLYAIENL